MLNIKPEEDKELKKLLTELGRESKSKIVFLIDKSGQLISRSDSPAFSSDDITFASLTAGNVAASEALSKLLGDKNLNHMFTETQNEGIYMVLLEGKYILVSIFDKNLSNLGIVRVKMKKFYSKLSTLIKKIEEREKEESKVSTDINLEEIDLDSLFK
ncbi:roadblock/LC7 domain-containing protein [Desulfurobacterium thermolithotrophum]|uniref:roadblock/LC7 domain-containing protein n=1 Tax=Desulfurobacterium thermolithotrophum TaxID=64160 RepID=UPI0013D1D3A6|nr:roadblock/LC7 domain-containing protein [Desulfurobacterium thermolithotrophum]